LIVERILVAYTNAIHLLGWVDSVGLALEPSSAESTVEDLGSFAFP
jgi:hypothetical protein